MFTRLYGPFPATSDSLLVYCLTVCLSARASTEFKQTHHALCKVQSANYSQQLDFPSSWFWKGQPGPSRVTLLTLRLCCSSWGLAGVGGDSSCWYCHSPSFPITIACAPTWLPDWQRYFRGNYYDSDYVNHFTLCSMWYQIAVAWAAHFSFPLMCRMAVWGIFSLFYSRKTS